MKLSTQISIGFLIVISIDLLDSYVNYSLTRKVNTNTEFLTTSEAIIRNSSKLNKGIVDMQNAFKGFLLIGDDNFLRPYYNNLNAFPILIDQENKLIGSSVSQRRKLDSIAMFHKMWVHYADLLIKAKKSSTSNPFLAGQSLFKAQLKKQFGKGYNDQIAKIFLSFDHNEYKIREDRRLALAESIKQTERFSLFFSVLTIIVGFSCALFLVIKISRRIASMVKLAENISRGDFSKMNDDKNDELSSLSISLNSMSDKLSRNIYDLEKTNDELNQFAYVVSHDLKAPVRGIYNVIQWISEDFNEEISPKMRQYLDIIPDRIKRMENLIDGLLDYARISREKQIKEEVDVAELINDLAEEIIPKEFEFTVGKLPKLWTERLPLRQVFSNLISNAVKYTPEKGGKINISCIENEFHYEFTVSDNGPGIAQQYHQKIFVIFQTLRDMHDSESTGIGLAIVKKIIEDRNCTIRINSYAGNGADFIFTWPKKMI